jgi:hypothetical protein
MIRRHPQWQKHRDKHRTMTEPSEIIVIPKENAVFRLDANGRWLNAYGRFEKKRIIDYFHGAIGHDENGYFVSQDKGHALEKVYFPYEDTALFVFDLVLADPVVLVLNTGKRLELNPETLWIENDHLYLKDDGHRIRFTDRTMMKIAGLMEEGDGEYVIRLGDRRFPIREVGQVSFKQEFA